LRSLSIPRRSIRKSRNSLLVHRNLKNGEAPLLRFSFYPLQNPLLFF
jgi:hypothetical protein